MAPPAKTLQVKAAAPTKLSSVLAPACPSTAISTAAPAASGPGRRFDITSTYLRLLDSDPDMNMSIAAIEALVEALAATPVTTISETFDLLSTYVQTLKDGVANHIGLSAGTDLFQRYLLRSIQPRTTDDSALHPGPTSRLGRGTGSADDDFYAIKAHLVTNGRVFLDRAKEARSQIARFGRYLISDGATILTNGGSRVVGAVLLAAAAAGIQFRVVYVLDPQVAEKPSVGSAGSSGDQLFVGPTADRVDGGVGATPTTPHHHADARRRSEGSSTVTALRQAGVPVATIPSSAVGYALQTIDMVIVGAEGVVETGGVISRLGTYQIGLLAKAVNKPFYVVVESHKFVRLYPLDQYNLPVQQDILVFAAADNAGGQDGQLESRPVTGTKSATTNPNKPHLPLSAAIDYTPPNLIQALITESGVLTPSAVSEELIKIWF